MLLLLRCISKPPGCRNNGQRHRTFIDAAGVKFVRDRGLDHAVEKERNVRPVLNLKDLIKSEPSKSIPLSIIAQNRGALNIPTRPIEFIRKYPSIFQEFHPGGIGIHPHVKLTPEVLDLDAEEQLIYQSESYKQKVADRLLKLLMIGRVNKIPLNIIDRLKWDLGLPHDYVKTIIPEFPDYFRVNGGSDPVLELVCWSNELSISVVEKKAMNGKIDYEKGTPVAFSLQYSNAFEMDKKYKKWVDDWQKLPYISPYENAFHLTSKSDESDKWAVAILHEILNLFVPKKVERDNVLLIGAYLGLRSRFKKAFLHHPGIFYISSKIGTHTVVLREAFKRGLLIEKNPLMNVRFKCGHLMNEMKEDQKLKNGQDDRQKKEASYSTKVEGEELVDDESGEEQEGQCDISDSEFEDDSDDLCEDEEEEDGRSSMDRGKKPQTRREKKGPFRATTRSLTGRNSGNRMDRNSQRNHRKTPGPVSQNEHWRSSEKFELSAVRNSSSSMDRNEWNNSPRTEKPAGKNLSGRSMKRLYITKNRRRSNLDRTSTW